MTGTRAIIVRLVLAVATFVAGGCDTSSNPISPTFSSEPRPTFTLSGVVTEETANGVVPVGAAFVQELRSQSNATTDAEGHYRISGLLTGNGSIRVVKEGYLTSSVDISADARLDIRILPIPPTMIYTVSGVVFEVTPSGRMAVEGVHLYCDSCGSPSGHTFTDTDAQGHYSFDWSLNGVHQLQVWKDGYVLTHPAGTLGSTEYINATVNGGDTNLDIEVVRR
jgi:Carboxypeptidase regulatory-like domain